MPVRILKKVGDVYYAWTLQLQNCISEILNFIVEVYRMCFSCVCTEYSNDFLTHESKGWMPKTENMVLKALFNNCGYPKK